MAYNSETSRRHWYAAELSANVMLFLFMTLEFTITSPTGMSTRQSDSNHKHHLIYF